MLRVRNMDLYVKRFAMSMLAATLTACGGGGGSSAPSVTITTSPVVVRLGESAVITWASENSGSCQASGAWDGSRATAGTATVTPASLGVQTYTLTCSGGGRTAAASATVRVDMQPPAVEISVAPASVTINTPATITWSSVRATSCEVADEVRNRESGTSGSASIVLSATGDHVFTVTCAGDGGND